MCIEEGRARSSDSVFWPIFQTFHTLLLPTQVEAPLADESLEDFLQAGSKESGGSS